MCPELWQIHPFRFIVQKPWSDPGSEDSVDVMKKKEVVALARFGGCNKNRKLLAAVSMMQCQQFYQHPLIIYTHNLQTLPTEFGHSLVKNHARASFTMKWCCTSSVANHLPIFIFIFLAKTLPFPNILTDSFPDGDQELRSSQKEPVCLFTQEEMREKRVEDKSAASDIYRG